MHLHAAVDIVGRSAALVTDVAEGTPPSDHTVGLAVPTGRVSAPPERWLRVSIAAAPVKQKLDASAID